MSRTFWLVSSGGKRTIAPSTSERQAFRADAIQIEMYYVESGEAIVISRGRNAILVDGGSGTNTNRNDQVGGVLGSRLARHSLQAIVTSHPHRDHSNFHHALVTAHLDRFAAAGALYFDNATPAAAANWQRLQNWQPNLPFQRVAVADDQAKDADNRIPLLSGEADAYLLRGSTNATSIKSKKYWSVFLFLRFRDAWMLFTGDAYKGYENLLLNRLEALNPSAHLLKVTHHGSSGGTSEQVVSSLRPKISIASTDSDPGHRLETDVRARLSESAIYATYDTRRRRHPGKDIIVRTDGRVRQEDGFAGILFEVWRREPAL